MEQMLSAMLFSLTFWLESETMKLPILVLILIAFQFVDLKDIIRVSKLASVWIKIHVFVFRYKVQQIHQS
jgi:hypothetical protein